VARRRFQRGSVFQNSTKTMWLGTYAEYVLDSYGAGKRIRKQIVLSPIKVGNNVTTKREAQRLLQPYVDRANSSLGAPSRERKSATFEAFAVIWERDYLSLSKPATRSGTRSYLKRLKAAFGTRDMRQIDAGDIQRLIAAMVGEGLAPKTLRNLWGTISLIWNATLAQKYVDAMLPKPKLPRRPKKQARFFTLSDVAKVIAASQGEHRAFYWLTAETGLRAGELAGLKLTDIDGESLTVNQSIWHGKAQSPKTDNAVRTLALSLQLVSLLWEQIARQKAKGHEYLFTSSTGKPWDMDVYRERKMRPFLKSLGIAAAGFHAFRHFNVSLMDAVRVPLKTIQERLGHALTGSFTLDVYGGKPEWTRNLEAARQLGAEIESAVAKAEQENKGASVNYSGSLTTKDENGSGVTIS
jgi:integrase